MNEIIEYYKTLKSVGIDFFVIVLSILGTHFFKIYILKDLMIYNKRNKGLLNGCIALALATIGSFIFTTGYLELLKTIFTSFIMAIGSQTIMQWIEHRFRKGGNNV